MIGKNVAGVDGGGLALRFAKATLDLHIDPIGVRLHVDNSVERRAALVALLHQHQVLLVVVEATGR